MNYCKVENGVITKYNQTRKQIGIGENSPESTLINKGWYPLTDNAPTIDPSTERISGSTYVIGIERVDKNYTVHTYTQQELDDMKTAEDRRQAKTGLDESTTLTPPDVYNSLVASEQAVITAYRDMCIDVINNGADYVPQDETMTNLINKY